MSQEVELYQPRNTIPQQRPQDDLSFKSLKSNPNADPIRQLLYAALHGRRALDRLDRSIRQDLKRVKGKPDPLFFTPPGQWMSKYQTDLRNQLAAIAKQYVALGIEERQTRMIEDWASVLLPFLTALQDDPDLALSRAQKERFPLVVERHLRIMEARDR